MFTLMLKLFLPRFIDKLAPRSPDMSGFEGVPILRQEISIRSGGHRTVFRQTALCTADCYLLRTPSAGLYDRPGKPPVYSEAFLWGGKKKQKNFISLGLFFFCFG